MYRVEQTDEFAHWLRNLRDARAQLKITQRIFRIEGGNLGDWKSLGEGVSELRIDYGPGYRLYYTMREQIVVILLCGSDKSDQRRAIEKARELANEL